MTDPTTSPPADDVPTFDVGEVFGDDKKTITDCLAQLRKPEEILAEALFRILQADGAQDRWAEARREQTSLADPISAEDLDLCDAERAHLMDSAAVLERIAATAGQRSAWGAAEPLVGVDLTEAESETVEAPTHEPQALRGVRGVARLTGHYVGVTSGREWLHIPGAGYIDITDATEGDGATFALSGRLVSATPDHVLMITDGGYSVVLPRSMVK